VSWQVASFAGLFAVLVVGFAWFERSRPSARLVALVAALAALAVAGRLALAPVPNVVATTDIALITGFALGAAPGFAVGALAAPISNVWLGQGPWTPWEMAGWGMAGLLGAALARATGGRVSRLGLACACAFAGFAYGALLDYSLMATYGGEQSVDRYVALSARGIPFNVAHAAGNFAIALAAGPALIAMIARYRERLTFRWHPAGALPVALALCLLVGAGAARPAEAAPGAKAAVRWLEGARAANGGYAASPGMSPSPQMTGWAMLGLEAAGRNPLDVGPRGKTPVDYLRANAKRIRNVGELELAILALKGAGVNPRRFGGRDLVAALEGKQRGDGSFGRQVNLTAYGLLALRAGGGSGIGAAARWLRASQNADGGWGFAPGARSDPDSTGAAMQGLALTGSGGPLKRAVKYLRRVQQRGGGWGLNETGVTNSQSTAWAVQGLVAAGVPPGRVARAGRSGLDFLARMQNGNGSYSYSTSSDQTPVWVTAQSLLAVSREALPIEPVPRSRGAVRPEPDAPAGEPSAAPGAEPQAQERHERKRSRAAAERAAKRDDAPRSEAADDGGPDAEAGVDATPASSSTAGGGRDDDLPFYVGGGLGALALALVGGFFWYRRRLP
jgi:energy-coupling factor transport system substrate-specific component